MIAFHYLQGDLSSFRQDYCHFHHQTQVLRFARLLLCLLYSFLRAVSLEVSPIFNLLRQSTCSTSRAQLHLWLLLRHLFLNLHQLEPGPLILSPLPRHFGSRELIPE